MRATLNELATNLATGKVTVSYLIEDALARIADEAALASESERLTSLLLQGAPAALGAAKELLDLVTFMPIDEDLAEETVAMIAERRVSDEAKEGLSAFLEKRKPSWAV